MVAAGFLPGDEKALASDSGCEPAALWVHRGHRSVCLKAITFTSCKNFTSI